MPPRFAALLEGEDRFRWSASPDVPVDVVLEDTLYHTEVYDLESGDDAPLRHDMQVYEGLGKLGGVLWEQDVHVLLRVATLDHPALQQVVAGGYDDTLDMAYVISTRAPYTLDYPDAITRLRDLPEHAFRHLEKLSNALSLLHGEGIIHRNIWPGTLRFTPGLVELRFSRFEMSALVAKVVRGMGDDGVTARRRVFLDQPDAALVHIAPERLDELLDGQAAHLDSGAGDVFSLAMTAASWFVDCPELPVMRDAASAGALHRDVRSRVRAYQGQVRSAVSAAGVRGDVPEALADLLSAMLNEHSKSRPTAGGVEDELARHREAILSHWQPASDVAHLLIFMPPLFHDTLYQWGYLHNDPANHRGPGVAELRERIEEDLQSGSIAYSHVGASGYIDRSEPELADARIVLIGERYVWFCQHYREENPVTGARGAQWDEALLIKYVAERERIDRIQALPFQRLLPSVDALRSDLDPRDLAGRRRGRPSWRPLIDTIKDAAQQPLRHRDMIDAFEWLLTFRRAEITVGTYPFTREEHGVAGRSVVVREDAARRRLMLARDDVASELAQAQGDRSMGDHFDTLDPGDVESTVRVALWPTERQGRGRPSRAVVDERLDPERLRLTPDNGASPVPVEGELQSTDFNGTRPSLRRQARAVNELAQARMLLDQLDRPSTIRGFRSRWNRAGSGLAGGASDIVVDMLVSQPLFALHGPPGTGKTTVVAHAVAAHLAADPTSRILVTAQANAAVDNIGRRVLAQIHDAGVGCLPVRVASKSSAENVDRAMTRLLLDAGPGGEPSLVTQYSAALQREVDRRLRTEPQGAQRELLLDFRDGLSSMDAELRDRVQHSANLVFATCEGATAAALGAHGMLPPFDWVIVEEAAKAWPTELAIPLMRASRWTLIGDHRQLPAHRREEIVEFFRRCATSDRAGLRSYRERQEAMLAAFDLFGGLFSRHGDDPRRPLRTLTRQFRMCGPIAETVSRAFYDGRLTTDPSANERDHGLNAPTFVRGQSLVWLDTTGWDDHDVPCWSNDREAALVAAFVSALRPQPLHSGTDEPSPLAVLTPYHAQRRRLEAAGVSEVHTVHSFQGREAEIVVVSLVRSTARGGPRTSLGHLSKPEVANVLMSRARRLLVLVGRFEHFRDAGCPHWKRICETVEEVGLRVPWTHPSAADLVGPT